jgi:hypothetical protein
VAHIAAGLLVLLLAWTGLAVADDPILDPNEPPVRLKKKKKPDADKAADKKMDTDKEDPADKPDGEDKKDKSDKEAKDKPSRPDRQAELKEQRERLVKRMLGNMETVEERLAKNDPGLSTRELQRDILKDLDTLIEQTKRQPPPQSSSRQSRSSKSNKNSRNSKKPRNSSSSKGRKKSGSPMGGQQDNKSPRKGSQQKGKEPGREGKRGGNGAGGGDKKNDKKKNKLAEIYKNVWGHLPETMRAEMEAYSRAKYIREYEALLKQYYSNISDDDDDSNEGD